MVLKSTVFFLSLLVLACNNPQNEAFHGNWNQAKSPSGKSLFLQHCAKCHGKDGKKGLNGAKDLTRSRLTDAEILQVMRNGRKSMPPVLLLFKNPMEVDSVGAYIKTFRK